MGDYDDAEPAEKYGMIGYNRNTLNRSVDSDVNSVKDIVLWLKKWSTVAFSVLCVIFVLVLVVLILELGILTSGESNEEQKQSTNFSNVNESKIFTCDEGWIDGGPSGLGCLHLSPDVMVWAAALDYCAGKRSTLLEIRTKEQMKFVRTLLNTVEMYSQNTNLMWWGAGTDETKEGDWVWKYSGEVVGDFVWYHGKKPFSDSSENSLCFVTFDNSNYGSDCRSTEISYPICQQVTRIDLYEF